MLQMAAKRRAMISMRALLRSVEARAKRTALDFVRVLSACRGDGGVDRPLQDQLAPTCWITSLPAQVGPVGDITCLIRSQWHEKYQHLKLRSAASQATT